MTIRAFTFWTVDKIKGGLVRKFYQQILSTYFSNKIYHQEPSEQLERILEWSVNHVPFYKTYKNYRSINDFPVINKFTIKQKENDFLAPQFYKSKLFVETTSGSTGTPLKIYQDSLKRKRARADTIAFSHLAGYELGTKLYYSRVWNNYNRKSLLSSKIQNIVMQ